MKFDENSLREIQRRCSGLGERYTKSDLQSLCFDLAEALKKKLPLVDPKERDEIREKFVFILDHPNCLYRSHLYVKRILEICGGK